MTRIRFLSLCLLFFVNIGFCQHDDLIFSEVKRFRAPEAVQGVAVDETYAFAIGTREIAQYDKNSGNVVKRWSGTREGPIIHLDSGVIVDGKLVCAHSNYSGVPMTSSVEIWDAATLEHIGSHSFGIRWGSCTWIDRHNGYWWAAFAHYNKLEEKNHTTNAWSTVVKFGNGWEMLEAWVYPEELIKRFDGMSNSGGSWGPDGRLYLTGHDRSELYAVRLPEAGSVLVLDEIIPLGIQGQGIAWDRSEENRLYTILRESREIVAYEIHSMDQSEVSPEKNTRYTGVPWIQFHSTDFKKVSEIGLDKQINHDTGSQYRDYSRIWIGSIQCPAEKPVTIEAEADNGMRFFLNDTLLIDGWSNKENRSAVCTFPKESFVPFRLEHFQDGGVALMQLYWSWPGHEKERIPASAFSHTQAQRDTIKFQSREINADFNKKVYEDHYAIYNSTRNDTLTWTRPEKPIPVSPGPHLFVGDYLISSSSNIQRLVEQPQRSPTIQNPVVKSAEDRCFQPYMTVLRSSENGRFRIWYGAWREDQSENRSYLACMESVDGIHWIRPATICQTPEIQFGSEVLDRGSYWSDPDQRYVYSYWLNGGMRIAVSADGLNWQPLTEEIVLYHNHDINNIWWDPIRQRYMATISMSLSSERWGGRRRTTLQSYSTDLIHWSEPAYVLYASPEEGDEGETQFYAMSGFIRRGAMILGLVKILRDDIVAQGVAPGAFGRAHTTLVWSYDGEHWMRDQTPFFEPDPDPGAWDHAHAWIDEQLMVGDSLYLYYGGYKQGHKMNRFEERQIGLVKMYKDRYVAREAEAGKTGILSTVPMVVNHSVSGMSVNAAVSDGKITVQVIDASTGTVIPGMDHWECLPITGNGGHLNVFWSDEAASVKKLSTLLNRTVQFVFYLQGDARLYAFELK